MRRHDLHLVEPTDWAMAVRAHAEAASLPLIADWARQGRPVIIRRFMDGEPRDRTPVALPLPPSLGKRRIALSLAPEIKTVALRAVSLADASANAPLFWRGAIRDLVAIGADFGTAPDVYGALLWQHLTGLRYLSATSDLDVLWRPRNAESAAVLRDALRPFERNETPRLDGEIVLPCGAGVAWREFVFATSRDVLTKTIDSVSLRDRERLFQDDLHVTPTTNLKTTEDLA